jgi:hypothetical protein
MNAPARLVNIEPNDSDKQATSEVVQRVLSGNFSVTLQSTDQRSGSMSALQMQGPVYTDDRPEDVNERVDLYRAVLKRQAVLDEIDRKQSMVDSELAGLEAIHQQVVNLKETQKTRKLATTENAKIMNYDDAVSAAKERIAKHEFEITALKKKAGL